MEMAKRARKAETPKQPSLSLMLRAPYLYPDRSTRPGLTEVGGAAIESAFAVSTDTLGTSIQGSFETVRDPQRKFEFRTPLAVGTLAVSGTTGRRRGGKCGTLLGLFSG